MDASTALLHGIISIYVFSWSYNRYCDCEPIEENPEHAKVWLDTLSKGGSMSAKDLAIHAGCDVSTDEPLKQAIAYVGHLVDQLESLTAELKA